MMTLPQLVRLIGTGAMKSFNCEVKESDARLLSIALPKDSHLFSSKMTERSMLASPNVRGESDPSPSESAAGIGLVLMVPVATAGSSTFAGPHAPEVALPVH